MTNRLVVLFVFLSMFSVTGSAIEVFGKGSYSKYYYNESTFEENISGSTGVAVSLLKGIRLEGRYAYIQKRENQIDVIIDGLPYTLSDRSTRQVIYSLGADVDLGGSRSSFQPYIYFGAGIISYSSSFKVVDPDVDISTLTVKKYSGNFGLGFRWLIGKVMALELEAMAYATDIDKPKPLINCHISAGLRLFIG